MTYVGLAPLSAISGYDSEYISILLSKHANIGLLSLTSTVSLPEVYVSGNHKAGFNDAKL